MTTAAEVLRAIEVSAELATVPELRLMIGNTLDLLPTLGAEDQAHANALLLKLDSLLREQQVDSAPPVAPDPILFDLDALLTEDADARAEALLSGLDRWLRNDVHPDALPELFVSRSPHHASVGHPEASGQAGEESAVNLRRLAGLAAAAIARAAHPVEPRTRWVGGPPDIQPDPPRPRPLLRGWRMGHCTLCTWTRRLSGGCTHSAWT
jgi:hypothetical protein